MVRNFKILLLIYFMMILSKTFPIYAQSIVQNINEFNSIENLQVMKEGSDVFVRIKLKYPLTVAPTKFSTNNPVRLILDFPNTISSLKQARQKFEQGIIQSVDVIQVQDRTRVVLSMQNSMESKILLNEDGLLLQLTSQANSAISRNASNFSSAIAKFSPPNTVSTIQGDTENSIRDIKFRRDENGDGRIIIQLANDNALGNVTRKGSQLIVMFKDTFLPGNLQRQTNVTDFATPITQFKAIYQNKGARIEITPHGNWEYNAYHGNKQFIIEVHKVKEQKNQLVKGQGRGYHGKRLSLNFQNIDLRSVLQVIADFTQFNIVTSDSVQGSITLRLQNVPWDQALDIILQAKGLDKRKTGNVIWIAPSEELQARERLKLESDAQVTDLEPLSSESFQMNYHKANEVAGFLQQKNQTILSKRGSVTMDERSNRIFIMDVPDRLDAVRKLLDQIDVPPKQVLIEARIIEANRTFSKELGTRLGMGGVFGGMHHGNNYRNFIGGGGLTRQSGGEEGTSTPQQGGQVINPTEQGFNNNSLMNNAGYNMLNMPVMGNSGTFALSLWNSNMTRFLNLEISALETDGNGRTLSNPKVLTANQVEASIEQGTEIPYQDSTSSGATSVEFKKAVLSLKVKPQITPDGRVQLAVQVHKDQPLMEQAMNGVPPIQTKNVQTEVMVDNGGTVVIGGIYEETIGERIEKVPLLGDIPFIGRLFTNKANKKESRELMVFITPRIVSDNLTLAK